jgi:hypothetical protein
MNEALTRIVTAYGKPDQDAFPSGFEFDPEFIPSKADRPEGFKYTINPARFTFPRGGKIQFERINVPDDGVCQVRALYYFAT